MKILPTVIVLTIVAAMASLLAYLLIYTDHGPTSEEFQVYETFVTRLSADRGWRRNDMAVANRTSGLSTPQPESHVPFELRPYPPDKRLPPQELVDFCGNFCGREFMRKNLTRWSLRPNADASFDLAIVDADNHQRILSTQRVFLLSRVGFDLWHRRSVLTYSEDCSDSSGEVPTMCVELGQAFLQKTNGTWHVDHLQGFAL
jgi:hypothetical protein